MMRKRTRGALVFTLGFMFLVFALAGALYIVIETSRARIMLHKQKYASACIASSGIEYSRHMIKNGPWKEQGSVKYTSPPLGTSGYFVVTADKLPGGAFRVNSTGYATASVKAVREETIAP